MIDPVTFRVRIGCFNLRNRAGRYSFKKVSNNYYHGPPLKSSLLFFLGILSLTAVLSAILSFSTGPNKYPPPKFVSNWNNTLNYSVEG